MQRSCLQAPCGGMAGNHKTWESRVGLHNTCGLGGICQSCRGVMKALVIYSERNILVCFQLQNHMNNSCTIYKWGIWGNSDFHSKHTDTLRWILCALKIRLGRNMRPKNLGADGWVCGVSEVTWVIWHPLITGINKMHAFSDLMGWEMTQDLRVLTGLPKDLPEFRSQNRMAVHNHLYIQFWGDLVLSYGLHRHPACTWCRDIYLDTHLHT